MTLGGRVNHDATRQHRHRARGDRRWRRRRTRGAARSASPRQRSAHDHAGFAERVVRRPADDGGGAVRPWRGGPLVPPGCGRFRPRRVRPGQRDGGGWRKPTGQPGRRPGARVRHAGPRHRGPDARTVLRCDHVRARRIGSGDPGHARTSAQRRGAQRRVRGSRHDGMASAAVRTGADDRARALTLGRGRSRVAPPHSGGAAPVAVRRRLEPGRRSLAGAGQASSSSTRHSRR